MVGRNGRGESDAFQRDRHMFGCSEAEQTQCRLREIYVWYALITTDSIEGAMNMCPLFNRSSSERDYVSWLETVIITIVLQRFYKQ